MLVDEWEHSEISSIKVRYGSCDSLNLAVALISSIDKHSDQEQQFATLVPHIV